MKKVMIPGHKINEALDKFKVLNPSWERLFSNKTQREACERLIKKYGEKKVNKMILACKDCQGKQFAPSITTPYELEMKLAKLIDYYNRNTINLN